MKDHFQLLQRDTVDRDTVGIRPGNILVPVRDYNTMNHLRWILERDGHEGAGRGGDVRRA